MVHLLSLLLLLLQEMLLSQTKSTDSWEHWLGIFSFILNFWLAHVCELAPHLKLSIWILFNLVALHILAQLIIKMDSSGI